MAQGDGHGERLSRDQERAIATLLVSPNYVDAARKLRVHTNTLRTWTRQPAFATAYAEAREELLSKTIAKMQKSLFAVTEALTRDLTNKDPAVRHRAAELLLNATLKGTETLSLAQRVTDLESLQAEDE